MKNIEDIYELSPMQQGMLFHTVYSPTTGNYFNQLTCTITGNLDLDIFKQSWETLVNRHQVLRTSIHYENLDNPVQVVHRNVILSWQNRDWQTRSAQQQEIQFQELLAQDRQQGFDIGKAPLVRFILVRCAPDKYRFCFSHHHILMDGWCIHTLTDEVLTIYKCLLNGEPIGLETPRPYRDYIQWLQKQDKKKAEAYWKEEIQSFHQITYLSPVSTQSNANPLQKHEIRLAPANRKSLGEICKIHAITLNTLVQGAWSILFSRYLDTPEVMFGTTISNRPPEIPGVGTIIGLFINTLPTLVRVEEHQALIPWLTKIQEKQAQRDEYAFLSLMEIRQWSHIPKSKSLFDTLLVFENYPGDSSPEETIKGLEFTGTRVFENGHYPLNLLFLPEEALIIKFYYDPACFSKEVIPQMGDHFLTILQDISENPEQSISQFTSLTKREKHLILEQWNNPNEKPLPYTVIHHGFQHQADTLPDHRALQFKDRALTYKGLSSRVNRWAMHLRETLTNTSLLVGLSLERSIEAIIGILAILKAGGAYVPLDPALPPERLLFIIKDAGIQMVLTGKNIIKNNPPLKKVPQIHYYEHMEEEEFKSGTQSSSDTFPAILPTHPAYVIYTSGSTGKPKGAIIKHQGVCNFVNQFTNKEIAGFGIGKHDHMLQFATLNFDASASEIFSALLSGAVLILYNSETPFALEELQDLLIKQQINIALLPPAILNHLPAHHLPGLNTVISAGDTCTKEIAEKWKKGRIFINGYGPTEASMGTTLYQVTQNNGPPPIGKPIPNTIVYILDKQMRLCPVLIPGELCISGTGLAHGYLNRPELTAEKFCLRRPGAFFKKTAPGPRKNFLYDPSTSPYQTKARLPRKNFLLTPPNTQSLNHSTIYHTGDKARWLTTGDIQFMGRLDFQVKIRGYRIELGEIENRLSSIPSIKEAVVLTVEDKSHKTEKNLCAFLVPNDTITPEELDITTIRNHLKKTLPHYMIPAYSFPIQTLPLTTSGKINRKALNELAQSKESEGLVSDKTYSPPQNEIEEKLIQVWQEILQVDHIGRDHDFFEIGGNSIKAIQVVSRLSTDYGITVSQLFKTPTPARLAPLAAAQKGKLTDRIEQLKQQFTTPQKPNNDKQLQLTAYYSAYKEKLNQDPLWQLDLIKEKSHKNVLLTGAAGYLGAHLLWEFLTHTQATLYLPLRAANHTEARERIQRKLTFYFGANIKKDYWNRIKLLPGDMSQDNFGLSSAQYEALSKSVDMILHAAGNVKHYGKQEDFNRDNIAAVEQLLKFAQHNQKPEIHYISTTGLSHNSNNGQGPLFTEYTQIQEQQYNNLYLDSKATAEKKVLTIRQKGINASIYRVGNLVAHRETGRFQDNIGDNGFYALLKGYITLGAIPDTEIPLDLLYIDYAAQALRILTTRKNLCNEIFHIGNTLTIPAHEFATVMNKAGKPMDVIPGEKFIDHLTRHLENDEKRIIMDRFLLHWGVFETGNSNHQSVIAYDRTQQVLKKMGITTPGLTPGFIQRMIRHCRETGFID